MGHVFIRHKALDLLLRTQKWKWGRKERREEGRSERGREREKEIFLEHTNISLNV